MLLAAANIVDDSLDMDLLLVLSVLQRLLVDLTLKVVAAAFGTTPPCLEYQVQVNQVEVWVHSLVSPLELHQVYHHVHHVVAGRQGTPQKDSSRKTRNQNESVIHMKEMLLFPAGVIQLFSGREMHLFAHLDMDMALAKHYSVVLVEVAGGHRDMEGMA
jgi:hypothetical protein